MPYPRTSWADASFRARNLILALPHVAIQRSNTSPVRPSTPLGTIFLLPKSSVTSLRHNDRCTHGNTGQLASVLLISIFGSHKAKWPGCCCILASPASLSNDHLLVSNVEIWIEHCSSRVLTLSVFILSRHWQLVRGASMLNRGNGVVENTTIKTP